MLKPFNASAPAERGESAAAGDRRGNRATGEACVNDCLRGAEGDAVPPEIEPPLRIKPACGDCVDNAVAA